MFSTLSSTLPDASWTPREWIFGALFVIWWPGEYRLALWHNEFMIAVPPDLSCFLAERVHSLCHLSSSERFAPRHDPSRANRLTLLLSALIQAFTSCTRT